MDSALTALTEMDRAYEENKRRSMRGSLCDDMSSDQDSFVSALDVSIFSLPVQLHDGLLYIAFCL